MSSSNLLLVVRNAGKAIQKFLKTEDLERIPCRNCLVANQQRFLVPAEGSWPSPLRWEVGTASLLFHVAQWLYQPVCILTHWNHFGIQDFLNKKFSVLLASSLLVYFSIACFLLSHIFCQPLPRHLSCVKMCTPLPAQVEGIPTSETCWKLTLLLCRN